MIKKAILLAAGFGTRLRPLTLTTPKPLLPLDGELLIDHQLHYLKKYGITEVAINLHHLGDMIREHVGDGSKYGITIHYSIEQKILGTGGGVKKAGSFFKEEPLLALNSDALIETDLSDLVDYHTRNNFSATMVLKKLPPDSNYTPIDVSDDKTIKGFEKGEYHYTGLQIVGPELLNEFPPAGIEACLIQDGYKKLIEKGARVGAYLYDDYWNDLGTPESYDQAKSDISNGKFQLIKG
ncbi:MAG: nucleotidyltransferase family protein [Deltaproteobacteria bacterium]|jgi:NDP-sugar pyrophosphorylase family protein|nr:nucleotidyltransferase family protein [Deltaproteobacteria bacterium]